MLSVVGYSLELRILQISVAEATENCGVAEATYKQLCFSTFSCAAGFDNNNATLFIAD